MAAFDFAGLFTNLANRAKGDLREVDTLILSNMGGLTIAGRIMAATMIAPTIVLNKGSVCRDRDGVSCYLAAEIMHGLLPATLKPTTPLTIKAVYKHIKDGVTASYGTTYPDIFKVTVAAVNVTDWDANDNGHIETNLVAWIEAIAVARSTTVTVKVQQVLTLIVMSMSKQGTASGPWMRSRLRALNLEVGDIEISREDVALFWTKFGSKLVVTDADWKTFFDAMEAQCKTISMRLSITAQQAKHKGFTAAMIVCNALNAHKKFTWATVVDNVELTNAVNAGKAVKANNYLGFKSKDANASARAYPNATYLALRMLIELDGQTTLREFVGPVQGGLNVKDKLKIDHYFDKYKASITSALPSEVSFSGEDLADLSLGQIPNFA